VIANATGVCARSYAILQIVMQRARIDAIQIRSQARTDPWEILNYTFYISTTAVAVAIEGIERAVVTAITLISSLMIMAQGGLVLVNFRFITGGITY